jgi:hypothetical protein
VAELGIENLLLQMRSVRRVCEWKLLVSRERRARLGKWMEFLPPRESRCRIRGAFLSAPAPPALEIENVMKLTIFVSILRSNCFVPELTGPSCGSSQGTMGLD